jgi:hypothetical protein
LIFRHYQHGSLDPLLGDGRQRPPNECDERSQMETTLSRPSWPTKHAESFVQ